MRCNILYIPTNTLRNPKKDGGMYEIKFLIKKYRRSELNIHWHLGKNNYTKDRSRPGNEWSLPFFNLKLWTRKDSLRLN